MNGRMSGGTNGGMNLIRPLIVFTGLVALWQVYVWLIGVPPYLLPGPVQVIETWFAHGRLIAGHALVTGAEILIGLALGTALGGVSALCLAYFRTVRPWLMPLLVISQAIPVFALAPLLVLWFGYGMASKVAMAVLIIFFPVTASFFDGLRRTDPGWLDLAATMGASPLAALWHIRIPAALPAMASGLKVAASVAPIGAVVGEWVGSSGGLGYLMLHANARMQIDLMFAALLTLAVIAVAIYFAVDRAMRAVLTWQPEEPG